MSMEVDEDIGNRHDVCFGSAALEKSEGNRLFYQYLVRLLKDDMALDESSIRHVIQHSPFKFFVLDRKKAKIREEDKEMPSNDLRQRVLQKATKLQEKLSLQQKKLQDEQRPGDEGKRKATALLPAKTIEEPEQRTTAASRNAPSFPVLPAGTDFSTIVCCSSWDPGCQNYTGNQLYKEFIHENVTACAESFATADNSQFVLQTCLSATPFRFFSHLPTGAWMEEQKSFPSASLVVFVKQLITKVLEEQPKKKPAHSSTATGTTAFPSSFAAPHAAVYDNFMSPGAAGSTANQSQGATGHVDTMITPFMPGGGLFLAAPASNEEFIVPDFSNDVCFIWTTEFPFYDFPVCDPYAANRHFDIMLQRTVLPEYVSICRFHGHRLTTMLTTPKLKLIRRIIRTCPFYFFVFKGGRLNRYCPVKKKRGSAFLIQAVLTRLNHWMKQKIRFPDNPIVLRLGGIELATDEDKNNNQTFHDYIQELLHEYSPSTDRENFIRERLVQKSPFRFVVFDRALLQYQEEDKNQPSKDLISRLDRLLRQAETLYAGGGGSSQVMPVNIDDDDSSVDSLNSEDALDELDLERVLQNQALAAEQMHEQRSITKPPDLERDVCFNAPDDHPQFKGNAGFDMFLMHKRMRGYRGACTRGESLRDSFIRIKVVRKYPCRFFTYSKSTRFYIEENKDSCSDGLLQEIINRFDGFDSNGENEVHRTTRRTSFHLPEAENINPSSDALDIPPSDAAPAPKRARVVKAVQASNESSRARGPDFAQDVCFGGKETNTQGNLIYDEFLQDQLTEYMNIKEESREEYIRTKLVRNTSFRFFFFYQSVKRYSLVRKEHASRALVEAIIARLEQLARTEKGSNMETRKNDEDIQIPPGKSPVFDPNTPEGREEIFFRSIGAETELTKIVCFDITEESTASYVGNECYYDFIKTKLAEFDTRRPDLKKDFIRNNLIRDAPFRFFMFAKGKAFYREEVKTKPSEALVTQVERKVHSLANGGSASSDRMSEAGAIKNAALGVATAVRVTQTDRQEGFDDDDSMALKEDGTSLDNPNLSKDGHLIVSFSSDTHREGNHNRLFYQYVRERLSEYLKLEDTQRQDYIRDCIVAKSPFRFFVYNKEKSMDQEENKKKCSSELVKRIEKKINNFLKKHHVDQKGEGKSSSAAVGALGKKPFGADTFSRDTSEPDFEKDVCVGKLGRLTYGGNKAFERFLTTKIDDFLKDNGNNVSFARELIKQAPFRFFILNRTTNKFRLADNAMPSDFLVRSVLNRLTRVIRKMKQEGNDSEMEE